MIALFAAAAVLAVVPAEMPAEWVAFVQPTAPEVCGSYPQELCANDQRAARGRLLTAWNHPAVTPDDRGRMVAAIKAATKEGLGTNWATAGSGYSVAYAAARAPTPPPAAKAPSGLGAALLGGFAEGLGRGVQARLSPRTIRTHCSKSYRHCTTHIY